MQYFILFFEQHLIENHDPVFRKILFIQSANLKNSCYLTRIYIVLNRPPFMLYRTSIGILISTANLRRRKVWYSGLIIISYNIDFIVVAWHLFIIDTIVFQSQREQLVYTELSFRRFVHKRFLIGYSLFKQNKPLFVLIWQATTLNCRTIFTVDLLLLVC